MLTVMAKRKKASNTQEEEKKGPAPLFLRLTEEEDAALMAYVHSHRVPPERTAVAKVALREFLEKVGYWPPAQS
ncbi:hypothetical protein [Limnoglobus roseus]|uniref:CopG family transcriptional regulator n=1 Tax=Limnoglobus roseus TaxID=2598579 RepID=A0A5C1AJG0_9BACT|nr:hypothetical protein [Limnoglobus roseus]QEL18323.1 hypothetical protein PX52LOC_05344 [Limnoglobus roseus]